MDSKQNAADKKTSPDERLENADQRVETQDAGKTDKKESVAEHETSASEKAATIDTILRRAREHLLEGRAALLERSRRTYQVASQQVSHVADKVNELDLEEKGNRGIALAKKHPVKTGLVGGTIAAVIGFLAYLVGFRRKKQG